MNKNAKYIIYIIKYYKNIVQVKLEKTIRKKITGITNKMTGQNQEITVHQSISCQLFSSWSVGT